MHPVLKTARDATAQLIQDLWHPDWGVLKQCWIRNREEVLGTICPSSWSVDVLLATPLVAAVGETLLHYFCNSSCQKYLSLVTKIKLCQLPFQIYSMSPQKGGGGVARDLIKQEEIL